ncbi:hypothetical protein LPJ75_000979, partial [Coemansia sp. RSA 2598]
MSGSRRRVDVVPSEDLGESAGRSTGHTGDNTSAISAQLRLLESTKATDRTRGIQQLADVLDEDRRRKKSVLAASLDQSTWEQVVTWTSRALLKEAQTFVNRFAEEPPSQASSAASDRLGSRIQTQYSVHTRHIWVAAMPFLSARLAQFVVKFIVETLDTDQCLFAILGLDFAKVLRAWAAHSPHLLSCKNSRAVSVVNLCIRSLSRFGSGSAMVDTQASSDSSSALQSTAPGDAEFAAVILAIVSTANPARLARIADGVFGFCADYCSFYTRENVCTGSILESAIVVVVAKIDSLASDIDPDNRRRIDVILSCCLQLWPTRSAQLKATLVQAIRVLTRIIACVSHGPDTKQASETRLTLELALKSLTAGSWDKFKFMTLPKGLLSIWPILVSSTNDAAYKGSWSPSMCRDRPAHFFARLEAVVDPLQFAFFDTVAFLVAHLTAGHSRRASSSEAEAAHRKKRTRTAPTALARMLTAMGSDDSLGNAMGAAQVVWFMSSVYVDIIGTSRCLEALDELGAFIESSNMTQRADLAEWVLGCYLSLSRLQAEIQETGSATTRGSRDVIWQHAVAGVESGLAGAAGLVADILHRSRQLPSPEARRLCVQAAAALKACPPRSHGLADVLSLVQLLSQFMFPGNSGESLDKSISGICFRAIALFCQHAARQLWPLHLFSALVASALGFSAPKAPAANQVHVLDGSWTAELQISHALQMLDAFDDSLQVCEGVIGRHSASCKRGLSEGVSLAATSALSPLQWVSIAQRLLDSIGQCTENEYAPVSQATIPYIAHVLWRISQHVQAAQGAIAIGSGSEIGKSTSSSSAAAVAEAAQITDLFSERLVSFAADTNRPELLWQTLFFISPWTRGYSRLASLEVPMNALLSATFDPADTGLLCHLALARFGSGSQKRHFAGDQTGGSETQVSVTTETSNKLRHLSIGGMKENMDLLVLLESAMLGTASGLVKKPCLPAIEVLATLAGHEGAFAKRLFGLLPGLVEALSDEQLLLTAELICMCALLCSDRERVGALLKSVKTRVFSAIESRGHSGHMPALFRALQVVCLLADACVDSDPVDEDLPELVARVSNDACDGLVGQFVELYFIREIVGPWYRRESPAICHMLSVIDQQPVNYLLHRAQTAFSFAVRMAAEEQKAAFGLQMPFILPSGGIAIPDLPETPIDESLLLATHDFGLAMLIHGSQSMVPGALGILIMQAEPGSEVQPFLRKLCYRLLRSIARLMGFESIDRMIKDCAADILSIDTGYFDPICKVAPQVVPQLATIVAAEHILQRDFARASASLAAPVALLDDCICRLYAHMVVLSVSDPELYAAAHSQVLASIASNASIEQTIDDSPHALILHLLMLYLPETDASGSLQLLLADIGQRGYESSVSQAFNDMYSQQISSKHSMAVPKWGRRYGYGLIFKAIDTVLSQSKSTRALGALAGPQIAWVALHLQHYIQSAQSDDERQRLLHSLCLLIASSSPGHLGSHLVQSTVTRIVVDSWLCSSTRTAFQACLAFTLALDSVSCRVPEVVVSDFAVGLVSTLTGLSKSSPSIARDCTTALVCLLKVVFGPGGALNFCEHKIPDLLVGSSLGGLYEWSENSMKATTLGDICGEEDRERLALVADQAAALLLAMEPSDAYNETCAEFLIASLERLVQLALPLDSRVSSMSMETQNATIGASVQIDLALDVIKILSGTHSKVQRYLQGYSGDGSGADRKTVAMLLRSSSLLLVLAQSSIGTASSASAARARLLREGDLYWRLSNIMAKSHNQAAITAAIGVVSDLKIDGDQITEPIKHLDLEHQRTLQSVSLMPAMVRPVGHEYPPWIQQRRCQRLDSAFLEAACSPTQTSARALSELVCALASYPESTKLKVAIPLMFVDAHSASCLLPHVLYDILPRASLEVREEIAAFLLDFVHNWQQRAPAMTRDLITRTLQVRQLDYDLYSDIREFFRQLPLALFEMADLASKLGMLETTAFLLECDLTCTGSERLTVIDDITSEARELLRTVYHGLGNQSAAQMLNPVKSVSDV